MLFGVVIGLFGLMNVGAAVGFGLDAHERRKVLAQLQTPELGFRVTPEGTWVWRFSVDPLEGQQGAPTGTAVALAELLGVPYSRLRAALPDELVGFGMGDVMGRRQVLSRSAMEAALTEQRNAKLAGAAVSTPTHIGKQRDAAQAVEAAPAVSPPPSATRRTLVLAQQDDVSHAAERAESPAEAAPLGDEAVDAADTATPGTRRALMLAEATAAAEAQPEADSVAGDEGDVDVLDELVGTALVLAFLQVGALMPVVDLARCKSAAAHFFDGITVRHVSSRFCHSALLC